MKWKIYLRGEFLSEHFANVFRDILTIIIYHLYSLYNTSNMAPKNYANGRDNDRVMELKIMLCIHL